MIKERKANYKKEKIFFLTTEGKVISSFDISNIIFITTGKRISPYMHSAIFSYADGYPGIVKQLDAEEAQDMVDESMERRVKIHGSNF